MLKYKYITSRRLNQNKVTRMLLEMAMTLKSGKAYAVSTDDTRILNAALCAAINYHNLANHLEALGRGKVIYLLRK